MKRKLVIPSIVVATILIALVAGTVRRAPLTVFFSSAQAETNGTTTSPTLKAAFYVTNTARRAVFLQIAAIERHTASGWIADTQALPTNSFRTFGKVAPNGTARLSFEWPHEPVATRLRILVSPHATPVQKAQFALRRWWANVRGQGQYRQLWVSQQFVPTYQVITPEVP